MRAETAKTKRRQASACQYAERIHRSFNRASASWRKRESRSSLQCQSQSTSLIRLFRNKNPTKNSRNWTTWINRIQTILSTNFPDTAAGVALRKNQGLPHSGFFFQRTQIARAIQSFARQNRRRPLRLTSCISRSNSSKIPALLAQLELRARQCRSLLKRSKSLHRRQLNPLWRKTYRFLIDLSFVRKQKNRTWRISGKNLAKKVRIRRFLENRCSIATLNLLISKRSNLTRLLCMPDPTSKLPLKRLQSGKKWSVGAALQAKLWRSPRQAIVR